MREPATSKPSARPPPQQQHQQHHQQQQHPQQQQLPLTHLSAQQLQEMAQRQQHQIEAQQQMLVAKEQRLKYLRQQDFKHQQMAAEYERLRRLREKVEAQELKLRKLRALRGQNGQQQQQQSLNANAVVLADLDSIRSLFNEKEKELVLAVRKVDDLTHQLEELRSGRSNTGYPPQLVELERLRRELAYRKQLNEQQNGMIAQQRAQLNMGQDEMMKIDNRILELQDRLSRKRMMNQQLASQISAATTAKQAQLRAIQQGMANKNKNKPVSTVEPFQRQPQDQHMQEDLHNKINKNGHHQSGPPQQNDATDPKYQTLPFGTKFGGQGQPPPGQQLSKSQKIEQLKQEKENNNVQFSEDLPPPPPHSAGASNSYATRQQQPAQFIDHQGNFKPPGVAGAEAMKPVSSVAPVYSQAGPHQATSSQLQRPTQLFPDNYNLGNNQKQNEANKQGGSPESPTKLKPALPPKPKNGSSAIQQQQQQQQQPPPYIPAPPPDSASRNESSSSSHDDSSITIRGNQSYQPSGNLSVSAHPEEGTSVDDDVQGDETDLSRGGNQNVHISINRRIEMPPAFHFPEDQTPPSDLIGRDLEQNGAMYHPMMNQIYKEFDHLSTEEKHQLFAKSMEEEDWTVPEVESDPIINKPPGIINTTNLKGRENSTCHNKHVCFDPLALLLDASLEGELDLVKKTARQVTDPSAANDEGITALHNSICAGHFDIVRFLVEFGCDVNAQDSDGWTPLHCAASCNNLPMVRFLVEHGACVFATTFSDSETAAEKCEEDEEGYAGCSEYLYSIQEKLGIMNGGQIFAVFDYAAGLGDELSFESGDSFVVVRKGDDVEREWWWVRKEDGEKKEEGYIPRNFLGLYARVAPQSASSSSMSEGSDSSSSENDKKENEEEMMEEKDLRRQSSSSA